jgi:hypothetical protein
MRTLLIAATLMACAVGTRAQVRMGGDVDFWTYGSRIRVFVEEITNFGDTTTDRLRFRVWGTKDRDDDFSQGRLFAMGLIPRLRPNETLHDVGRTLHLFRPPSGWYYVTLTLEERTFDEEGQPQWEVRDVVEFDGQYYFRRSDYRYFPFPF